MGLYAEISSLLKIPEEELKRESLKTYLRVRLRKCESEIFKIRKKYGVSSAEEFEEKFKRGEIEEKESWEDFFKLDNLEAEREALKKALEILEE